MSAPKGKRKEVARKIIQEESPSPPPLSRKPRQATSSGSAKKLPPAVFDRPRIAKKVQLISGSPPLFQTKKRSFVSSWPEEVPVEVVVTEPEAFAFPASVPPSPSIGMDVPDEILTQYFLSSATTSSAFSVSLPLSQQLEKVESLLNQGIPIEHDDITILQISLFDLAQMSDDVPSISAGRAIFHKMALQVGDIAFRHSFAQQKSTSAARDLNRLKELQEKSSFQRDFHSVEAERQSDLIERDRMNQKRVELTAELDRIRKEMVELQPKIREMDSKLLRNSKRRVQLYNQSTSLDEEISYLVCQREAFERDYQTGDLELSVAR